MEYVAKFQWKAYKYRIDLTAGEIGEMLSKEIGQIDTLIKARMNAYYQDKAAVDSAAKAKRYTPLFMAGVSSARSC